MNDGNADTRDSSRSAESSDAEAGVPLTPGRAIDVLSLELPLEPLPAEEVRRGSPNAGSVSLDLAERSARTPDAESPESSAYPNIGVWEMTVGTAVDVEVDECFIVLSGRATVVIRDGAGLEDGAEPGAARSEQVMELRPGTIGRLSAGMHTEWTVHENLRKIYLMP